MSESPVLPAPTRRIFPGVAASRHNCSRTSSPPPAPPAAAASVFTRSPARTRSIATRALSLDPRKRDSKERAMGFEPTTSSLGSWHSTTELRPQNRPRFNKHLRAATSLFLPLFVPAKTRRFAKQPYHTLTRCGGKANGKTWQTAEAASNLVQHGMRRCSAT
jgi:hypothetical protein